MIREEFGSMTEYLQAAGAAAIIAEKRAARDLEAELTKARADLDKVHRRHRPVSKQLDFTDALVYEDDEPTEVQVCAECDRIREEIDETAAPVLWPCSTMRDLAGDTTTETRKDAAA